MPTAASPASSRRRSHRCRDSFDAVFDNTAFVPSDIEPMIELFRGRVTHYVFTSSQAVYRRSFVQPIRERFRRHAADDADPRKAYGVGKVQCEDLLEAEWQRNGFPATCLRVGHTLGPRSPQPTRDPAFFARLEAGRPILIPGEGFAALQLVHINDVARLMASLLGNERVKGQGYNVSGAEVTSIVGVVHLVARAMGVQPSIVEVPMDDRTQTTAAAAALGRSVDRHRAVVDRQSTARHRLGTALRHRRRLSRLVRLV